MRSDTWVDRHSGWSDVRREIAPTENDNTYDKQVYNWYTGVGLRRLLLLLRLLVACAVERSASASDASERLCAVSDQCDDIRCWVAFNFASYRARQVSRCTLSVAVIHNGTLGSRINLISTDVSYRPASASYRSLWGLTPPERHLAAPRFRTSGLLHTWHQVVRFTLLGMLLMLSVQCRSAEWRTHLLSPQLKSDRCDGLPTSPRTPVATRWRR